MPISPSMLDSQVRLAVTSPSSASLPLPVKVTESPAVNEPLSEGDVIVAVGAVFAGGSGSESEFATVKAAFLTIDPLLRPLSTTSTLAE